MKFLNVVLIVAIIVFVVYLYKKPLVSDKENFLNSFDKSSSPVLTKFQIFGYNYRRNPILYMNGQKMVPSAQFTSTTDFMVYTITDFDRTLTKNICDARLYLVTSDDVKPSVVFCTPSQGTKRLKVVKEGGSSDGNETIWKLSC